MLCDNRDTGRSTAYPPGSPGHASTDLVADAIAVLDELGVDRAHAVGRSMEGGNAQRLAVDHPDGVATLTLISTSSPGPGEDSLSGMTPDLQSTGQGPTAGQLPDSAPTFGAILSGLAR